jgi:hypothetical protein
MMAAAIFAAPLSAQDQKVQPTEANVAATQFTIGDQSFVMPIPAEYCLPLGENRTASQEVAATDVANRTLVDMDVCGTFAIDYVLVKTPRQSPMIPISREEFFPLMARELETGTAREQAIEQANEAIAQISDGTTTLEPSDYGYDGYDDECLYASGIIRLQTESEVSKARAAGCTTLIANRLFAVHVYDYTEEPATIEVLRDRARDIALSIREQ